MPWKETSPVYERSAFIVEYRGGLYSFSALCEKYGISRKTGYKWVDYADGNGQFNGTDWERNAQWCNHDAGELH